MSVPEGKRKKGKLEIFVKAQELAAYTIQITSNQKNFPPQFDGKITNRIVDTSVRIFETAWEANNILVKSDQDWADRERLQRESIRACNTLITYIGIAKSVFHIRDKRIRNWADKVIAVRALLRAWHASDMERYKDVV